MDSVKLTLQNDPRAVLSPTEWAPALFQLHQSLGRPDPGTMVLCPSQLLQLGNHSAVFTVSQARMLEEGLWQGWEAMGPCWGSSHCLMSPFTQTGMQRATTSSLHPGLLEAFPFSHPHPGLGPFHSCLSPHAASALPVSP